MNVHLKQLTIHETHYKVTLESWDEVQHLLNLDGKCSVKGTVLRVENVVDYSVPYFARQIWITPSKFQFFQHRRREYDPNISKSYHGSSYQIADYLHTDTQEIWVGKIPGVYIQEICEEIVGGNLYHKLRIPTSMICISQLEIFNKEYEQLGFGEEFMYAICSHKKKDLLNLERILLTICEHKLITRIKLRSVMRMF